MNRPAFGYAFSFRRDILQGSNKNAMILEKILEKNITLFGLKYQPNKVAFCQKKCHF